MKNVIHKYFNFGKYIYYIYIVKIIVYINYFFFCQVLLNILLNPVHSFPPVNFLHFEDNTYIIIANSKQNQSTHR